jgi:hypothetical protein
MKYPMPNKEGFFWGKLLTPDGKDSRSGETVCPSHDYEVIHVVDNNGEGDEKYMAMVPGCSDWENLQNFVWGPEVKPYLG